MNDQSNNVSIRKIRLVRRGCYYNYIRNNELKISDPINPSNEYIIPPLIVAVNPGIVDYLLEIIVFLYFKNDCFQPSSNRHKNLIIKSIKNLFIDRSNPSEAIGIKIGLLNDDDKNKILEIIDSNDKSTSEKVADIFEYFKRKKSNVLATPAQNNLHH